MNDDTNTTKGRRGRRLLLGLAATMAFALSVAVVSSLLVRAKTTPAATTRVAASPTTSTTAPPKKKDPFDVCMANLANDTTIYFEEKQELCRLEIQGGDTEEYRLAKTATQPFTGSVTLIDEGYSNGVTFSSSTCVGSGNYSGFMPGATVILTNEAGQTVTTELFRGAVQENSYGPACAFAWSAMVPPSDFFDINIAGISFGTVDSETLAKNGWRKNIAFLVGSRMRIDRDDTSPRSTQSCGILACEPTDESAPPP